VAVCARGELAGVDHAMQPHHQGAPLDLQLRLVKVVDDFLHRQAERVLGQDVEDEVLDVLAGAAARHQQRPLALERDRPLRRGVRCRGRRPVAQHGAFQAIRNDSEELRRPAGVGRAQAFEADRQHVGLLQQILLVKPDCVLGPSHGAPDYRTRRQLINGL
jgi:hypothetical protein